MLLAATFSPLDFCVAEVIVPYAFLSSYFFKDFQDCFVYRQAGSRGVHCCTSAKQQMLQKGDQLWLVK
ncbi:hypothetical protein HMPREF9069_01362, partial [Atopobium sp. oral taxon 810 str. F0209]